MKLFLFNMPKIKRAIQRKIKGKILEAQKQEDTNESVIFNFSSDDRNYYLLLYSKNGLKKRN